MISYLKRLFEYLLAPPKTNKKQLDYLLLLDECPNALPISLLQRSTTKSPMPAGDTLPPPPALESSSVVAPYPLKIPKLKRNPYLKKILKLEKELAYQVKETQRSREAAVQWYQELIKLKKKHGDS